MLYSADGTLLQRKYIKNNATISKRDYLRGKEYKSDILESIYHEDGRVIKQGNQFKYEYWLKDHLGNVRVTFEDVNNNGLIGGANEIKSRNQYYTFGMEWKNRWELSDTISPENRYRFNGKERWQEMNLSLSNYHNRLLDLELCRFTTVDPMAIKRSWLTPYNFVQNNPLIRIDPTGTLDTFVPASNRPLLYENGYSEWVNSQPVDTEISQTFTERLYALGQWAGLALPTAKVGTGLKLFSTSVSKSNPKLGGKILIIDENLSPTLQAGLKEDGFITKIFSKGTLDNEIIDFAKNNDAIVLTNNIKDFKKQGITTIQVPETLKPKSQVQTVISKLNNISDQASKNCDLLNCGNNIKLREF